MTSPNTGTSGRPKPAFFFVVFLVVAGLLYFGFTRYTGKGVAASAPVAIH